MKNLELDMHLCFAVYSTWNLINKAYKNVLDQLDMTYAQYLVMLVLWSEDGQTVNEIGAKLFLQSNTLSPLLKRLEAKRLLKRVRDKADERTVRIFLTHEGTALAEKAKGVPHCLHDITGEPIDILKQLKEKLAVFRNVLEASLKTEFKEV